MANTQEPQLSTESEEVYYPSSDGEPMSENDETRELMFDTIKTLEHHFADDPEVYLLGNLLVYYQKGNHHKCVAPDVLFVRGVPKKQRDYYQTWVEGKGLDLVIEISSESTFRRDLGFKSNLYFNRLEVKEYFLFDSSGTRLSQGPLFALVRDGVEIEERLPDARGRILSELLGLELAHEQGQLRFYDPDTGERLETVKEREARLGRLAQEASERALHAEQRAQHAEQQAEESRSRTQEEVERRKVAEDSLKKLEEELRLLRK